MKNNKNDLIRKYKQDTGMEAYKWDEEKEDYRPTTHYLNWLEDKVEEQYDLNKSNEFTKVKQNDIMK